MSRAISNKPATARLDFRLNDEHKQSIEQAARESGQSLTEFAISTLLRAAREIIQQSHAARLSNSDREIFLAMLDSDTEPNASLQQAAARYKQ